MKKCLLAFLFTITGAGCCFAEVVNGQITLYSGTLPKVIFLRSYFTPSQTDSIAVDMFGGFKLQFNLSFPASYALCYGKSSFNVFINPREQNVRINLVVSESKIEKGVVEGSGENNAFNDFEILINEYDNQLLKILHSPQSDSMLTIFVSDYNEELTKFQKFYTGTYTADVMAQMRIIDTGSSAGALQNLRTNFFTNIPFTDSSIMANPLFANMVNMYMDVLCDTSATSVNRFIYTLMDKARQNELVYKRTAANLFQSCNKQKGEKMLVLFIEWFHRSADTALLPVLKAKVKKINRAMPGQQFIELNYKNVSGVNESLATAIAGNKLTLLVVWQSNCSHCREAMPGLKNLYQAYRPKGLEIYAVSLDEEEKDWRNYSDETKLLWKNTLAGGADRYKIEDYHIASTPAMFLISKEGIILKRLPDVKVAEDEVAAYFK